MVEVVPNERALLAFFLAKLHKLDPDVLVVRVVFVYVDSVESSA